MRSVSRWTFLLIIAVSLLAPGVSASTPTESAAGHQSRRNSGASKAKRTSKKATRGKSGHRTASRRRRGRSSRSRRGRQDYAQETSGGRSPAGIPTERVTEIQNALIKLGYLSGSATGQYDDATVEAMKQFQVDNQLAATGLPSAHALKRLGVSKRINDGYAVPVSHGGHSDKL